jgi:poly(3-hydroxybutyrate) depolymerase
MKHSALWFTAALLALGSALPACAKEKDKVQNIKFDFNGKQRTYLVQIPDSAAPTAPLPVVMLIHAQGDYDSGPMSMWKSFASREGFIVVSPEATSNTMWNSQVDGPDYLHAVLADVNKKHPIDPTKVFMFGDDTGGIYAMAVGIYDSQDWGAVCTEHAIVSTDDYQLFPHAQRKIAFQDWVGDSDDDHPLRVMSLEHDAFVKAGFPFDLKIIMNSSGTYGNVYDQVNEGCYHFFMQHPLPAPGASYLAAPAAAAAPASANP